MLVIAVFIGYLVGAVFSGFLLYPAINSCDFESWNKNACPWFVVEDDQYVGMKWRIATIENKRFGRGPEFDAKCNSCDDAHNDIYINCYYLHIEGAKWKNETKDKFRATNFRSPMLKPVKNACFIFYYWSNLENKKDEILLYQSVPGSRTVKTLFHVQGNTDKYWRVGRVDISSNQKFQLTFTGISYGRGRNIPDFAITNMDFWYSKCGGNEVLLDNRKIPEIKYERFDNLKEGEVLPNVFRVGCYKDIKEGSTDTFPFRQTITLYLNIGNFKNEAFMVSKCYNYIKDANYINTYFAIRGKTCFFGPDQFVKYDKYGRSTDCKLEPFDIKPGNIFVYTWNV